MNILVFNAGSSSFKYSYYQVEKNKFSSVLGGTEKLVGSKHNSSHSHIDITEKVIGQLKASNAMVDAVACRVVHGGESFFRPTVVDKQVLEELRSLASLAPLHNKIDTDIISSCIEHFPNLPTVAVFDTAFHHNLPDPAASYALPNEISKKYKLRRYGFHGISHQSVSERLLECLARAVSGSKLVTCHLGSGASVCAIKDGASVDTSMGFTPLEGLIMGTRAGDIDPGLILYLIEHEKVSVSEIRDLLNRKSGLVGLSQISADFRTIEKAASEGSSSAQFAIEAFCYRVLKYIGAYAAALGGVDAIAFSGGIGENSSIARKQICKNLSFLGIELDEVLNQQSSKSDFPITTNKSKIPVWVIRANENLQIARETYRKLLRLSAV